MMRSDESSLTALTAFTTSKKGGCEVVSWPNDTGYGLILKICLPPSLTDSQPHNLFTKLYE